MNYTVCAAVLLTLPWAVSAGSGAAALKPYARVRPDKINEGSALLASREHAVLWTLNDSGGKPALYPLDGMGNAVKPGYMKKYAGIEIGGAVNVDWEALTYDNEGNLVIGDTGNNANRRRDLTLYFVPEPDPSETSVTSVLKKVMFRYPDQDAFPPKLMNFDAEAMFWAGKSLYIISKNRADTLAKLYRLDSFEQGTVNTLKLLSSFDTRAMVTDAAINGDGSLAAVLTYAGAWLFEKPPASDDYFSGRASFLPFSAGQCEGLTFKGPDKLVISNEERELFEVPFPGFKPI